MRNPDKTQTKSEKRNDWVFSRWLDPFGLWTVSRVYFSSKCSSLPQEFNSFVEGIVFLSFDLLSSPISWVSLLLEIECILCVFSDSKYQTIVLYKDVSSRMMGVVHPLRLFVACNSFSVALDRNCCITIAFSVTHCFFSRLLFEFFSNSWALLSWKPSCLHLYGLSLANSNPKLKWRQERSFFSFLFMLYV
jgi:hypothetical protein